MQHPPRGRPHTYVVSKAQTMPYPMQRLRRPQPLSPFSNEPSSTLPAEYSTVGEKVRLPTAFGCVACEEWVHPLRQGKNGELFRFDGHNLVTAAFSTRSGLSLHMRGRTLRGICENWISWEAWYQREW